MRRITVAGAAIAFVLGIIGVVSVASVASSATPDITTPQTLHFDIVFSPFFVVDVKPKGPSKGDNSVFHDRLFANGQQVGEDGGNCVIIDNPPTPSTPAPISCTTSFRLPGGQITTQGLAATGAAPKELAVTGGTDSYQNVRGQATLVEFGDGTGSVTFNLIP
jgi:hypothetical protein